MKCSFDDCDREAEGLGPRVFALHSRLPACGDHMEFPSLCYLRGAEFRAQVGREDTCWRCTAKIGDGNVSKNCWYPLPGTNPNTPEVICNVRIEDVTDARPKIIWFGALTNWWTHREEDILQNREGLACDPLGGILAKTSHGEAIDFIESSLQNPDHYGRHGIRAFEAAHHGNCVAELKEPYVYTCMATWGEYNDAIDRLLGRMGIANYSSPTR